MRLRLALAITTAAFGLGAAVVPASASAAEVLVSSSPTRSEAVQLDGRTVSGTIYAFASPSTGASARFWLDDPAMAGQPRQVENNAPWDFAGGNSNGTARPFDTRTIANGEHTITVAVTLADASLAVAHARFTVANGTTPPPTADYALQVSTAADRSSPAALQGRTVAGTVYVFATPTTGSGARFWLDDTTMTGTPRTIENSAPWDFAGGNSNGTARPFDTRTLSDGMHTISVAVTQSSGAVSVAHAAFTVANSTTSPALAFDRATAAFSVQPGASPAAQQVVLSAVDGGHPSYSVSDNASWLSVTPSAGTVSSTLTLNVSSSGLAAGTYTATVTASAPGYQSATLAVTLSVAAPDAPDQVHLAWTEAPSSTLTVTWQTDDQATPSTVQWRAVGATDWQTTTGAPRPSGTAGTLHEATLRSLAPATRYEYRALGDGGQWSPVFQTRTAPSGAGSFDAIYVADTGLIGRTDGLATGTAQVRDTIASMDPLLVLGGGDYAYFNTDKRFGTLEATIDAWFDQMQPIAARAPLMPTYGNHEALLGEGYANWAARFPTPTGIDDRRTYSFDVGDVHFVSIFAVHETNGLSNGTLSWIEADINAAKARGQRWILPFFHVSPFADGSSHPSNLTLRAQLGPLFERTGVQVAIASHDQSYERTYPLRNVPASNTPTSLSTKCYTPADGVSWIKVSPGGKLSSKNGDFSRFQTFPAPAYMAFRDDTIHHFERIRVTPGVLRLEAWAVRGDGSPPFIQDAFEYRTAGCPKALELNPGNVQLSAVEGGSATGGVTLRGSDGAAVAASVSDDAPWLTVTPAQGSTPRTLTLQADARGLAPGVYHATVTAGASGYASATLPVTLEVRPGYRLLVSTSPTRSSPAALQGATLTGTRYVFVDPAQGATGVRFWLDDPTMSGAPRTIEINPPWDFAGGRSDGTAKPWDTRTVSQGSHTITARIDLAGGGSQTLQGTFQVSR
jgi:hypothetical protein